MGLPIGESHATDSQTGLSIDIDNARKPCDHRR